MRLSGLREGKVRLGKPLAQVREHGLHLPQIGLVAGPARFPQLVVIAALVAIGIVNLRWALDGIIFNDVEAYWSAAMRLREGEALYPAFSDINRAEVYRYSPWFAWLWVPLTYVPREVATIIWEVFLSLAGAYVIVRLVRLRAWLLLALFGPIVLDSVLGANVQTLLVATLLWGVERRSGPIWIAAAASLKAVPILLVLVYVGRRQWGRAGLTLLLAAIFAAPFLLYDLSSYTTDPGSYTLIWGTVLYWPLALLSVGAVALLARTRYAWLAASTAVLLTLPRVWLYNLTFLLIGLASLETSPADTTSRRARAPGEAPAPRPVAS